MSVNFCSKGLISSITSSSTCFEGHDVKNLVQINNTNSKGFMVDYFIKPPVSVTIRFICPVNVHEVVIKTCVGAQRSANLELQTTSQSGRGRAASIFNSSTADFLIFHKVGVSPQSGISKSMHVPIYCPDRFKSVEEIVITILRTHNSSVPCLGGVKVWGKPSSSVPPEIVEKVAKKWKEIVEPVKIKTSVVSSKEVTAVSALPISSNHIFPEEFIDPITCELMLCPMILPSGNIVDQSTLTKFYKAEEEWGRDKSDPFTGIPFSNSRKPFLNAVLKAKIDKYLVNYSESSHVKNIPRIICKKPASSIPGFITESSSKTSCTRSSDFPVEEDASTSNKSIPHSSSKRSIDEVISDCLRGFPSYVEAKKSNISLEECGICKRDSLLFRLPCLDLICRPCLVEKSKKGALECSSCSKPFKQDEPIRYHNA